MEKTLVNIFVPTVQCDYDIFVPSDVAISDFIGTIAEGVNVLSNGRYHVSDKEMLIFTIREGVLNPKNNLNDYDVKDGSKLILI